MPHGAKKDLKTNDVFGLIGRIFSHLDDVILTAVSIGIIGLAVILLYKAYFELFHFTTTSITDIISDMMFVLIIMELFRQVIRQLKREHFSLNPFLFIGIIASIRGILIMQIRLTMHEVEWKEGVTKLSIYAVIVLIFTVCYYLSSKTESISEKHISE